MYLFLENHSIFRICAEMYEPVDGEILQAALDDAMNSSDYFHICFDQEADERKIRYNHQLCTAYNGSTQRQIPSETNGYLFYVSFEQRNVYLTCHLVSSAAQSPKNCTSN